MNHPHFIFAHNYLFDFFLPFKIFILTFSSNSSRFYVSQKLTWYGTVWHSSFKMAQVLQANYNSSSKALFSFCLREQKLRLRLLLFLSPCGRITFCLLFFFSCYSLTSWGYSTGVHGIGGAGISLNGIKHGRQFGAGLDLGEEFTEQGTFIWNKSNKKIYSKVPIWQALSLV